MDLKNVLVWTLMFVSLAGAYFLGALHGQRGWSKWREFFAGLSWRGFVWAMALPACWLVLFYALVAYVRISLGRWPEFGHQFGSWWLAYFGQATWHGARALIGSLCLVPLAVVAFLFFRSWRHVSLYALAYAAAVGIAIGSMFLAPHPFLSWYFD